MSKQIALLFVTSSLLACKNGGPRAAQPQSTAPATPATAQKASPATPAATKRSAGSTAPDKCGAYAVDVKLPPRLPCKTDADCAWTAHRPGSCTAPLCSHHYRAGAKAWVKQANELHERVCRGKRYGYCVRVKCIHKKPEQAVCKESRCTLRFAPSERR